jgi:glutathione S-transferase
MVSCDRAGGDLITAETAAAYAHLAQKLAASAASGCNGNLLSVAAYAVACAAAYAETATLEVKAVAPNVEMREIAKSVIERVTAAGYAKVKLDTLVQCVAQMASERGVAPD